jgi:CRP-like cAMP-binding protein
MAQLIPISDEIWADISSYVTIREMKRKDVFITEGKICKEIGYINKGSFRYYQTVEGREMSTFFSFENNCVSSYNSFVSQKPSNVSIEAMEDAELVVIDYNAMQALYQKHPVIERFGRLVAEYIISCLEERLYAMLLSTPEQRYARVESDMNIQLNRIPQHYVASYLGITPESLSRIRKRRMQKHVS